MTDSELALRAIDGDDAAFATLAERYAPVIGYTVHRFYFDGAERQDVRQEALVGLLNACHGFDFSGRAAFSSFAKLCIERQVITGLKASQRGKHRLLTEATSLSAPVGEDGETLADVLPVTSPAADEVAEQRADLRVLVEQLPARLSDIERTVLGRRLAGATLEEAGRGLGRSARALKTADNAMGRVRAKATVLLEREAA